MLQELHLSNFPSGYILSHEQMSGSPFILSTCQRTLVLSFADHGLERPLLQDATDILTGENAYYYLLETICGLQSRLIGESEIVGQFKQAYKNYVKQAFKNTQVMRILEKLFKDAKTIRTQYLLGLSHKTYASITRKYAMQAKANQILILGSGNLAEDVINQFKKKLPCYLAARNKQRVQELQEKHPTLGVLPWGEFGLYQQYSHIVNTIGTKQKLFFSNFFQDWSKHRSKLFVDLGSPSPLETGLGRQDQVIKLENIFEEGAIHQSKKLKQIELAKGAMKELTLHRKKLFSKNSSRAELFKGELGLATP